MNLSLQDTINFSMKAYTFFNNPFLSDRVSFRKMHQLLDYTAGTLTAKACDATQASLLAKLNSARNVYNAEYQKMSNQLDSSPVNKARLLNKFNQLPLRLGQWDATIRILIDPETADYKKLFPRGRQAIYRCSPKTALHNLRILQHKTMENPRLSEVSASIEEFVADLGDFTSGIGSQKATHEQPTDTLGEAFYQAGQTLYAVLGGLMLKYSQNPETIEDFFPSGVLSSGNNNQEDEANSPCELMIAPSQTVVAEIHFEPSDKFQFFNSSSVPVYYYGALQPNAPNPELMLEIRPGINTQVPATHWGAPASKHLLLVNKSTTEIIEIEITKL